MQATGKKYTQLLDPSKSARNPDAEITLH